ncbi:hypothetical protein RHMOL_Rhmol03G0148800 [Rhododendron molle]|uniref:Uncharacterized protein n=1 Tax=Rhododendron molle TaxID=49168 RepID=A0ACC0PE36_RHOML|nr:hypothetical protein RHMOL_Rhmol03G0148800 [Rhododendron molle]
MEGNPGNHPQSTNQSADHLARLGAEHTEDFMFVMDMPIAMREFVIRDSLNIRQVLD